MSGMILPKSWRPKAQQILITWIAAWPTLTLILFLLSQYAGHWPLPVRALASATCMALLMNLVSVPLVRRLLGNWLRQGSERAS